MKKTFECLGKVNHVYIVRKRNKKERVFRFIRYSGIKDSKWIEEQLRDVWFRSYKIWANISKFSRPIRKSSIPISLNRMKQSPKLNSNIAETSLAGDQFRGRSI